MKLLFFALIFVVSASDLAAQARYVSGKVIGSEFRIGKTEAPYKFWNVPEAKILWKDSIIGTTDKNGQFRIELTGSMEFIRIGSIGMYPDTIRLRTACDYIEIILLPDAIYDFVTVKKEQRLRRRDRSILPQLYKKAFEQGIFKQEKPCR